MNDPLHGRRRFAPCTTPPVWGCRTLEPVRFRCGQLSGVGVNATRTRFSRIGRADANDAFVANDRRPSMTVSLPGLLWGICRRSVHTRTRCAHANNTAHAPTTQKGNTIMKTRITSIEQLRKALNAEVAE